MMRVIVVCGTRPNFVKVAPLVAACKRAGIDARIVHTGQHYDRLLNDVFFDDLEIDDPTWCLEVGSGTQAYQVATILARLEGVLADEKPDAVIVVGDVNSTLAGALAAATAQIPVVHVEAGLRSWDTSMPEEINRMLTDKVSSLLFTPTREASEILRREGAAEERIVFTGNIMAETLLAHEAKARERKTYERFGLEAGGYVYATCHRPENADDPKVLGQIIAALDASPLPVIMPVHPRTKSTLQTVLESRSSSVIMIEPVGYLDALSLEMAAKAILTDSAGVQQEAVMFERPCIVVRKSSERTVTRENGFHEEVRAETTAIEVALKAAIESDGGFCRPEAWDEHVSERIVDALLAAYEHGFPPIEHDLLAGDDVARDETLASV